MLTWRDMPGVCIIERENLIRELIEMFLELNDISVAGCSESYNYKTKNKIADLKPDVTICGSDIFPLNQGAIQTIIAEINQFSTSLIIAKGNNHEDINCFINASAKGMILRSDGCGDLLTCLKTVRSGRRFLSSAAREMHKKSLKDSNLLVNSKDFEELTEREIEIAKLILEFYSNKEISRKLSISYQTVKNHKRRIMKKLGLSGTGTLLKYLMQKKKELDL